MKKSNEESKYGVLFDLDGVIIDSESKYTVFWTEIERIYPTGIENYAVAIKGTTLPEIMKHYGDEAVKADIVRRITEFQASMQFDIYPGAEEFLQSLQERGIPAALVTSSDDRKMQHLFSQHPQLKGYFKAIIDASCVTKSKPHPQGYLLAADAIGRKADDCFVFEDSLQGLKAGKASGATVIAIATTYPASMLTDKATIVIGSLADIDVDAMIKLKQL